MKTKNSTVIVIFFLASLLITGCKKDKENDNDNLQTSDLFEGAFDNRTIYPEPVVKTYATQQGGLLQTEVYPGQIIILVSGPTADQVNQLVTKNGGTIIAQLPKAGHYVVEIDPAITNAFLNAVYDSPLVKYAMPNQPSKARTADFAGSGVTKSVLTGNESSIIQTVDVESMVDGCGAVSHLDAVARIAALSGVSVNTNDVSTNIYGDSDFDKPFRETIRLIEYSYIHKTPVVINVSLGGDDDVQGASFAYYQFMCHALETISLSNPDILDYAVVLLSCTNAHRNETQDINSLKSIDPSSVIWKHLYFVGSEEGAGGCTTPGEGTGYADPGTENYLAAPSCNQPVPDAQCTATGNSAAVPQLAGVVARTWEILKSDNNTLTVAEITEYLWAYQKQYSGNVPTPDQLVAFITGIVPVALYDGTWSGTFYYTATVPQEEGPPEIINTSFMISFTLVSEVNIPGYPHLLRFQAVSCSDPVFGATMSVVPNAQMSMVFLPGAYGSQSAQGQGLLLEFPNGSTIMTNNDCDGAFTVDPTGKVIASSALVEDDAFLASSNIGDANEPGSGPGGYAYNWCKFKHWSLQKQN